MKLKVGKQCMWLLIYWLLVPGVGVLAQSQPVNLVPNASFEQLRNLPLKRTKRPMTRYEPTSGYIPFRSNLNYWFKGTKTTPDLRITKKDLYADCARHNDDCDVSRTGIRMVGLMTYLHNTYMDDYREYMQVKLKKPLQPGVETFVELWVCKERKAKLVSNNIGFYFSRKKVFLETEGPLGLEPQVNCDSLINPVVKEWVKIEGSFVPDRPYEFVTIGNFYGNEKTDTMRFVDYTAHHSTPPYAYYLIDDVQVWQERDSMSESEVVFEPEKVELNKPFELANILFESNQATMQKRSFVELEKLLNYLKSRPALKLEIRGHTDDRGSAAHNMELSARRARAVYMYFVDAGIGAERLRYEGLGESAPVAAGETEAARAKNRRVEFYLRDE